MNLNPTQYRPAGLRDRDDIHSLNQRWFKAYTDGAQELILINLLNGARYLYQPQAAIDVDYIAKD